MMTTKSSHAYFSPSFLFVFALSAIALAFEAGRLCRGILIKQILQGSPIDDSAADAATEVNVAQQNYFLGLPKHVEVLPNGLVISSEEEDDDRDGGEDDGEENEDEDDEGRGEQLLVDLHNVDRAFLSSPPRLMQAMRDFLLQEEDDDDDDTVAFHTCHPRTSEGLQCWAVLTTTGCRISLATWPSVGSLALEIFWNDEGSLFAHCLDRVEALFSVPRRRSASGASVGEPHMQWAVKPRGFFESKSNPEAVDLAQYITGVLDRPWKKKVVSVQTAFQRIDVYDMVRPQFGSMETFQNLHLAGTYESQHAELFRPDRLIYLDGVMQSRYFGEAAYHEALVHPALVVHSNPRRVVIIGGGEGATLREVLKHKTVETATMVEIDEEMVNVSREYIPEWSDCSSLVGSAISCYDDPRAELFPVDAIGWFMERFGANKTIETEPYDVIIMDAL